MPKVAKPIQRICSGKANSIPKLENRVTMTTKHVRLDRLLLFNMTIPLLLVGGIQYADYWKYRLTGIAESDGNTLPSDWEWGIFESKFRNSGLGSAFHYRNHQLVKKPTLCLNLHLVGKSNVSNELGLGYTQNWNLKENE